MGNNADKAKSTKPIILDLGKEDQPCLVQVAPFHGVTYISARFWYWPTTGSEELLPGKMGINVDIDFGWDLIAAMIVTMNNSLGTDMALVDVSVTDTYPPVSKEA